MLEQIIIVATTLLSIFLIASSEGAREKEARHNYDGEDERRKLSKKWHTYQMRYRAIFGAALVYIAYPLFTTTQLISLAVILLAFFWWFYNGQINLSLRREFNEISTTSDSTIDKFFVSRGWKMWPFQLGAVILGILGLILL